MSLRETINRSLATRRAQHSNHNRQVRAHGVETLVIVDQEWKGGTMAKLTAAKKNAEPKKEFGLPAERKYPMPDASHARNAKARATQMEHQGELSASDKEKIDAKAYRILKK
jgi:hypothetical protein